MLRRFFDAAERQRIDVDEMRRRLDLKLHEIDQIGAPGNELGCRLGRRCAGRCDTAGPIVAKRFHVRPPSTTSRIAATMLGYAEHRQILPLIRSAISAWLKEGTDATSAVT